MTGRALRAGCLGGLLAAIGCGARTAPDFAFDAPAPACAIDADCARPSPCEPPRCVAGRCAMPGPKTCDDGDPCTLDACDAAKGSCTHTPLAEDADGDGHRAKIAGRDAPASCADDCDDRDPAVHPGAKEICDGKDDDCNGQIDEGVDPTPLGPEVVLGPTDATTSLARPNQALSFAGGVGVLLDARDADTWMHHWLTRLGPDLARLGPDVEVAPQSRYVRGLGGIAWAGDRFAVAWMGQDFEKPEQLNQTFLQLVDGDGVLRGTPQSVGIELWAATGVYWTGHEFVLPGLDRTGADPPAPRVARFSGAGARIGEQSLSLPDAFSSTLLPRPGGGWLAEWLEYDGPLPVETYHAHFAPLNAAFAKTGEPYVPLAKALTDAPLAYVGEAGAYLAGVTADGTLRVIRFDPETGAVGADTTPFTGGSAVARDPFVTGFGGRIFVAWSDDHRDGSTFEVYVQAYDRDLRPLAEAARLPVATQSARLPHLAAITGTRDAAVIWQDMRSGGAPLAYARKLGCAVP
jgi:hypothetical protein